MLIAIYVDDIVFATNSEPLRDEFFNEIKKAFNIIDQGPLTWIFGTGVKQDLEAGTVSISQKLYIEDLVYKYQPGNRKGRVTPCNQDILELLPGNTEGKMIHPQYRAIIGQLLWVSIISRPDISFAVSYLARFCASGSQEHFDCAVNVVSYLEATKDKTITYHRESSGVLAEHILAHCQELKKFTFDSNTILGFSDSSHGGERPSAGYLGMLADGPFAWSAFRLSVTPLSICQGEYHAATKVAVMCKAYADIMEWIGYAGKGPSPIFCDNKAAVQLSDSGISSKKLRHVATHISFLRELVNSNDTQLIHITTHGQLADIFTKPLCAATFHDLRVLLVK